MRAKYSEADPDPFWMISGLCSALRILLRFYIAPNPLPVSPDLPTVGAFVFVLTSMWALCVPDLGIPLSASVVPVCRYINISSTG